MITLTDIDINANSSHDHARKIGEILRLQSRAVRQDMYAGPEQRWM